MFVVIGGRQIAYVKPPETQSTKLLTKTMLVLSQLGLGWLWIAQLKLFQMDREVNVPVHLSCALVYSTSTNA